MDKVKLISIDSSTKKTGIAFFEGCELVDNILIDYSKEKDVEKRINMMGKDIIKYLMDKKPDILVCEHPQGSGRNVAMVGKLCEILGIIRCYAIIKNVHYEEFMPSQWRKLLGWSQGKKKREELKQMSIDYVKENFNLDVTDDEADSICIGIGYINAYK